MKDNKKHGVFWFFKTLLTIALVIYTCVRCCMIVSDKQHVSALDDESVTLSPAQTVALFGTQLNALVKLDPNSNNQTSITFDYAFPSSQIGWLDEGGGFGYASNNTLPSQSNNQMTPIQFRDFFCDSEYLVYVADSSQWGNSRVLPLGVVQGSGDYDVYQNLVEQGTVPSAQIHVPFSISLSGITGYYQSVFYSSSYPVNYSNPSWWSYNCLTLLTDTLHTRYFSMSGITQYGVVQQYLASMPIYGHTGDRNTVDETRIGLFAGWCVDEYDDLGAEFDVNGFTIDALMLSSVAPSSTNYNLWLLVGCPTLRAYNPPPVTTTTPAETIPAATYTMQTMPPAYTDTPQNILNQNLITNNYQLNLIIGQLNLIYNQLKLNGELNARLAAALDADNDPGLQFPENTNIRQYMSEVFYQTGTEFVYSPEDLQSYTKAIPWLSSMLRGQTWFIPFAFLGTIGLIMIVFSYLVFRR